MGLIDPSYLSPSVRLEIGDTDPTSYRERNLNKLNVSDPEVIIQIFILFDF